jgi:hypothetical protein
LGNAQAPTPVSITGKCNGIRCFAVDPVTSQQGYWLAGSVFGDTSSQLVAVSVFGTAAAPVAVSLAGPLCNDVICIHSSFVLADGLLP